MRSLWRERQPCRCHITNAPCMSLFARWKCKQTLSSLVRQPSFNTHTGRSPRQSTFPAAGSSARSTPPSSFRYRCDQHPRHPTTDLVAISAPPWPRPHSPSSPHPTLTAQLPRRLSRYHLTGSGVGPPTAGTAARRYATGIFPPSQVIYTTKPPPSHLHLQLPPNLSTRLGPAVYKQTELVVLPLRHNTRRVGSSYWREVV